ncbi:tRNA (adenosine(37)-N6)-threonylcarbamoyltransferase complex ATPase subunit type 1 TsaE [Chitinophaga sp.]|uniref:tRNA (adenosine(37)-N6)-threonylcarbamoyltransferase complex ATPase subunit type 1 TsaE n=1 Tax=Chitinophaga sp. TaxID=1869181 RepID=UPI0031D15C5E
MRLTFAHADLPEVARQVWEAYPRQRLFALSGEMGAGKTTLIKELCAAKGVEDATASPTFSIINEYRYADGNGGEKIIYHLDLYRLKSLEEAVEAGVEDCLYHPSAICFVEWPELVAPLLPEETLHIFLSVTPDHKRKLLAGHVDPGHFRAPSLQ